MHSHLLWLGLAADALGFESLFMQSWRLRETVLDLFERTTGGRVIFSVCKVGGVRRDIDETTRKLMVEQITKLMKDLNTIIPICMDDETVHVRLRRVGILTMEDAIELGCVGPMARASGLHQDLRLGDTKGVYKELGFTPVVETEGDCYARVRVRMRETLRSAEMILACLEQLPEGEIDAKPKGFPPKGEFFCRVEQPRGEALYYVKGNGTKNLERFRVRTPTNVNLPALVKMLQGCDLADVPNIILTIDPCISCCER